MPIVRSMLREQVRDVITTQIAEGWLSDGANINEARLAIELGVSRTPLREGLFLLAADGLIETKPNRGFFVPMPDINVVSQLYPVIGHLDAMALRLSGDAARGLINELNTINDELARGEQSGAELYALDYKFHMTLISQCPNKFLLDEIAQLWRRARRYDGALKRGIANPQGAAEEHKQIISKLDLGNIEKAAGLLEQHWLGGVATIDQWIKETHDRG